MESSRLTRPFWGVLEEIIASILVVLGGAEALWFSVILPGAHFAVVCVLAIAGFLTQLAGDYGSVLSKSRRT